MGNPTEVTEGQIVAIHGTASDVGGVVAAIEVSTDGGATWHPATGTANWTYSWRAQGLGDHTIKARAVDDSVNLQTTNVQSTELTVMASPKSSLFTHEETVNTAFHETDPETGQPLDLELGVKFQSSVGGFITGIWFYRAPLEIGTHEGHLWTFDGTLIATVAFTDETPDSGWQNAAFTTPVEIDANTTYIVSYHSNGDYVATNGYFFNQSHTSGDLTSPADLNGSQSVYTGGNGIFSVYVDSNPPFPTQSFGASNYWVDVTFTALELPPVPGGEFTVNTTTTDRQYGSSTAALGTGFVTVWTDESNTPPDTSVTAIRGQIFDADGNPIGGEFVVNSETNLSQIDPAVTSLSGGTHFVVVWTDQSGTLGDTGTAIHGQDLQLLRRNRRLRVPHQYDDRRQPRQTEHHRPDRRRLRRHLAG